VVQHKLFHSGFPRKWREIDRNKYISGWAMYYKVRENGITTAE